MKIKMNNFLKNNTDNSPHTAGKSNKYELLFELLLDLDSTKGRKPGLVKRQI